MTISSDPITLGIPIAIFILSATGFLVSSHIYRTKRKSEYLVCPIKFDCNSVVNSDYSRFFGIPVEMLGMLYYAVVALAYIFLTATGALPPTVTAIVFGLSTIAFLFSLYLMGILAFALRRGCSWCFFSAILSTTIFILSVIYYGAYSFFLI